MSLEELEAIQRRRTDELYRQSRALWEITTELGAIRCRELALDLRVRALELDEYPVLAERVVDGANVLLAAAVREETFYELLAVVAPAQAQSLKSAR